MPIVLMKIIHTHIATLEQSAISLITYYVFIRINISYKAIHLTLLNTKGSIDAFVNHAKCER